MGKSSNEVLLYGLGGHALVVLDLLASLNMEAVGYFEDTKAVSEAHNSATLLRFLGVYQKDYRPDLPVIIAVGNNAVRKKISESITHSCLTLIHPSAIVAPSATIGTGSIVLQGAVIQAKAALGCQVLVNAGAVIDHEASVADYCHIRPNAYVGGGAKILEGTTIPPAHVVERNTIYPTVS